jgi:SAM-dependent methyltransferase
MIVGPGAVTAVLAPLLNDAARSNGRLRRLIGDAARYADQVLRRIPFLPLRSLEPAELEAVLTRPHRLVVVDHSPRVLAAVARRLPAAECHCVDIGAAAPPVQADVVIAFNVICRLRDPAAGVRHLLPAVRTGGWLLMDDRSAQAHLLPTSPDFTQVAPKTYRQGSAHAAR